MSKHLTDDALCARGLAVLEEGLGPVHTLRFLALMSRQPFDYQRWRQQHFGSMSLEEILTQVRSGAGHIDDQATSATTEELGWPPGFFERTAGAWEGEPLVREDQGTQEERDKLL